MLRLTPSNPGSPVGGLVEADLQGWAGRWAWGWSQRFAPVSAPVTVRNFLRRSVRGVLWGSAMVAALIPAVAEAQRSSPDLSQASLESLTRMQISVSSFARKEEDLWKTPAAVFVISREDIARSGFSSIPELLRMVPGMQVAQIDASSWAVSARGFNSRFAEKLLVLIDGRTVYSEIFSGARWDQIDLPLEDVERIEVIRGPGAAVWGTNAVNGVVNIITRRARSTLGPESSGRFDRLGGSTNLRYGGLLGQNTQYRAFVNFIDRAAFDQAPGRAAYDGEQILRTGGRLDWQASESDSITVSGDLYKGHLKQVLVPVVAIPVGPGGEDSGTIAGGFALARWEHRFQSSDIASQVYFDDQTRLELGSAARTRTLDLDFQDHRPVGGRNDVVWGGDLRFTFDTVSGAVVPEAKAHYQNYLLDGFVEDEIALVPGRLTASVGGKIEYGSLAGFEPQPSARLLWSPGTRQVLWGAVSRAVVAPSIDDSSLKVPYAYSDLNGISFAGEYLGNPNFKTETVVAYELGYRRRVGSKLTLDLAGFLNDYQRLQSFLQIETGILTAPIAVEQANLLYVNGFRARTAGLEGSAIWKPQSDLSLQLSYGWIEAHLTQTLPGPVTLTDVFNTPRNTLASTISWSFARKWSAGGFLSYDGSLPASSVTSYVPAYTRLDLQVRRQVSRSVQFSAGGSNLLTPRHLEYSSFTGLIDSWPVPRGLFIKGNWTF